MGIAADALAIIIGVLLGCVLKKGITGERFQVLGIGIMLLSAVGFIENIFIIEDGGISGAHLLAVLFAFLIGTTLGEILQLEKRIRKLQSGGERGHSTVLDAAIFFGVGGMQICGPLALAVSEENAPLLLKSAIDFPFAVVFGSAYGKRAALSAVPVAGIQLLIAGAALLCAPLFSAEMIAQLCAMGYIILFFSGFSLVGSGKTVSSVNMLPGIALLIVYHMFLYGKEGLF